jgi:hypothetical protein
MKPETAAQATSVSPVLVKGACPIRKLVDQIVERNRVELDNELEAFPEQLQQGVHAGGGLLGRVAEFLVSQRGL